MDMHSSKDLHICKMEHEEDSKVKLYHFENKFFRDMTYNLD